MNWIEGWDRKQQHLLPPQIEEYVGEDNPVRFLDAFVGGMDLLKAGFQFPKQDSKGRGRPSFHPGTLLRLYLYGYLHQIRSSRRLEKECGRNLEVMWLLGNLAPDHKTIADFRKDNAEAFKAVVRQFTLLCRDLNLFGGELLAVDGTKIKAQNSPAKNWSQSKLEKQLARIDDRLNQYLSALDQADAQPQGQSRANAPEELKRKIDVLRQRQTQAQERLDTLVKSGQTQLSQTDPDSRGMQSQGHHVVAYNVQGVVDAKHHLLVVTKVTNASADQGQLATMAQAAKNQLEIKSADIVADGGYFKGEDIKECQEMGMEPHVPAGMNSPSERAGLYGKADFNYDTKNDIYLCPNGAKLGKARESQDRGKKVFFYVNREACGKCPLRSKCTTTQFRSVSRWEHEPCLERMAAQMAAHPEKLKARKTLIEHPWGTIKWLLPGGFLVRGIRKVGAEVSLAHWVYNFKRLMAIVGLKGLMAALGRFGLKPGLESPWHALAALFRFLGAPKWVWQQLFIIFSYT